MVSVENDADVKRAEELLKAGDLPAALPLFLKLKERGYRHADQNIGWIYNHLPNRDIDQAIAHYKIEADQGDDYAQHALGGLYRERGELERAIHYYKLAGEQGRSECLFLIYVLYISMHNDREAFSFLQKAADSGHPLAIRNLAFEYMSGRRGIGKIVPGLITYLRHVPTIARFGYQRSREQRMKSGR